MTHGDLRLTVETLLDTKVTGLRPLHGGNLSIVTEVELGDGRHIVAKTGTLVDREARMLDAMAAAGARVPQVLKVSPGLILMERLEEIPANSLGWQDLGHMLRHLHTPRQRAFGWQYDYAFGPVTIANTQTTNWPRFWCENRLLAGLDTLPLDLSRRVEHLAHQLVDHLPESPPVSLLHGDLWVGNILFSTGPSAWLIDPACYHGHAEVDLAMLSLFAKPDPAFFVAYGPLAPGYARREAIYQLWPALVHLRLFGSGYRPMVETRLNRLGV
ncbi:fructosamine kinase family protein [Aliisedimentitalea scapharcae]|uniref:Fructosamine kinase family protein n=1 Tax=Aliisedimentitalea scapharcae TaxID=1524259 RepID=A0ABZ2XP45_9RHOB